MINEYTAATAAGPIALTPELFSDLPRMAAVAAAAAAASQHQQQTQLQFVDEQHQRILDHYGTLTNDTINGMQIGNISDEGGGLDNEYLDGDEIGDVEEDAEANCSSEQIEAQQVQHFDIGVGSDSMHQSYDDDDNDEMHDDEGNSNDVMEQYDEETDDAGNGNNSCENNVFYQTLTAMAGTSNPMSAAARIFRRKTKSTQTNRKIKPVKRPGLVLKTPIAYQPCLDPSVIPIQRDGMGMFCIYFHLF